MGFVALLALALIGTLILLERRWAASGAPTDRVSNLYAYLLTFGIQVTLLPVVSLNPLAERFALVDLATWPLIWAVIAFTVLMDLGEFAFHRAQHAIPLLWRMHSLHHSDPNMNVTTTVRHFWGDKLIKAVTIWPAVALVLKPTPAVLLMYGAISLYHFFVHSNLPISFGRWSMLLNHPAYHRRHHSSDPQHFGSNFASLFPVFDWLIGSYRRPDSFPETGLERQPRSLADVALWPVRS